MKNFFRYWLPVIGWCIFIFIISSIPGIKTSNLDIPFFDKIVHFIEYFILGFFTGRALLNSYNQTLKRRAIIISIIFSSLYGISDEIHQIFIPQRQFELFDILIDGIGAAISQLFTSQIYGKN